MRRDLLRSQSLSLKSQSSPVLTVSEITSTASCVRKNTDILMPYFAHYGEKNKCVFCVALFVCLFFIPCLIWTLGLWTQCSLGEKKLLKLHFLSIAYNLYATVNKQIGLTLKTTRAVSIQNLMKQFLKPEFHTSKKAKALRWSHLIKQMQCLFPL